MRSLRNRVTKRKALRLYGKENSPERFGFVARSHSVVAAGVYEAVAKGTRSLRIFQIQCARRLKR